MPFAIESVDDTPFDRRLVLPGMARGGWLRLTYRTDPLARPLRPMIRFLRTDGTSEDFLMPGVALGLAHWLGRLPRDGFDEIRIAAEPGFVLERVGLRSDASLLVECALKRPERLLPALYTRLRGDDRRFRNILRSACAVVPFAGYAGWKAARLRPPEPDDPAAGLTIRLVMPAAAADGGLIAQTVASLKAQTHQAWRLVVLCDEGIALPDADDPRIERANAPPSAREGTCGAGGRGDGTALSGHGFPLSRPGLTAGSPFPAEGGGYWRLQSSIHDSDALGVLHPGDRLMPDAIAILAHALAGPEAPDLVYADEEIAGSGPRLKPAWSPDLALVTGYTGTPTLLSPALLARIGDAAGEGFTGLLVAAMTAARRVVHIPRILCVTQPELRGPVERGVSHSHPHPEVPRSGLEGTLRKPPSEWEGSVEARPRLAPRDEGESGTITCASILDRHSQRIGSPARAEIVDGVLDLHWPIPDPAPLATIVIPSRDRPDLIGRITQDVLSRTAYPAIELVIVDNGSTERSVLDLYERLRADLRVRIVPFPHPFDFAAMVNAGAAAASGTVLVFLNNDIAVTQGDWLAALVGQAVRPDVGAVGAKLLYGDGRLQHAGVVIGIGGRSGHILRRKPGDATGHLNRLKVAHEVSAVTAACLAVERRKFEAVGGFDQKRFPIDFNDADLCLRLAARGWKTVWTPKATLLHLESVSRGPLTGQARVRFEREAERFAERWRDVVRHDPYHHPAMTLTGFDEALE